jgi:hypothetical protein
MFHSIYYLLMMLLLASCMPETTTSSKLASSNSTSGGGTTTTSTYQEPTFSMTGTFVQEGANQTKTNLSLPLNFTDSFLIRGLDLSKYLRTLPNTTKFCMVAKYNFGASTDRYLLLSAKAKSYTDLVNKTTEFYLLVEPANDQSNKNDCLSYNLTNTLSTYSPSSTMNYSFQEICSNCSAAVQSSAMKLYFVNGQEVPGISLGSTTLTITGGTSSTVGAGCSESSSCKARGFDCCLNSQCVNDGSVRPSAGTDLAFSAAEADVLSNPSRFILYPQYYFVCESRPDGSTGTTGSGNTVDPIYAASVRLMELKHLYECLNKVDGEFSYCTMKFTNASSVSSQKFTVANDDINFSGSNSNLNTAPYLNTIVKVYYGGSTLYDLKQPTLTGATVEAASANDVLNKAQSVTITSGVPTSSVDDNLYVTYKVDGTCEKTGTSLAKCTKTFIQGAPADQRYTSTYHDSSKVFKLPDYANLGLAVIVRIGGIIVPDDSANWVRDVSSKTITFTSYPLYQNQNVEFTYYVDSNVSTLMSSKISAQAAVSSMCSCGSGTCNLKPVIDPNTSGIVNYECSFGTATTEVPVNQTVFVSNKNVPHRYYDSNGANFDETITNTQELLPFSYASENPLKPNNTAGYVGFNEVYGSFVNGSASGARPAKLVRVKKDVSYDVFVNSGSFASCANCGSDYYNALQKIFPQNFGGKGGGYSPDKYESRREASSSLYRSDDLLYGRACFLPVTMIPWTHIVGSSATEQRRSRLTAQHFLFANGYNRDWMGFDYGSLLGSYDGVTWFSIGNQRRIKASGSKLFLAVNAYFGDQSVDTNFSVNITETSSLAVNDLPDHDTESDGAECQKSHYCANDNDCFTQLGYEYSCQTVSGLTTPWPQFDANGTETVGSTTKTLASIIGGTNGQNKRCVYRGRGAPCTPNLSSLGFGTFNGSTLTGTLSCSSNAVCATTNTSSFNDRITRFAASPSAQNALPVTPPTDLVGLGARILGRPFQYYGTQSTPGLAVSVFNTNKVGGVCIPGKDINASATTFELNYRTPSTKIDSADKIFGIGSTLNSVSSLKLLNACPVTNTSGQIMQQTNLNLTTDGTLIQQAITQNLSSNLLDLAPLKELGIYSSTNGSTIASVGYQRNTCLRAPGASCFSDLDCGPSNFIAARAKSADLSGLLNSAEEQFWEEELTCGNPDFKYIAPGSLNPNYDLRKNVCCREVGKTLTTFTQSNIVYNEATNTIGSTSFKWCVSKQPVVAGVNANINSPNRYSRVHTGYDAMTCDPAVVTAGKTFALSIDATTPAERLAQILRQYTTLDTVNQRTCCTKNWVRSFATSNGGGHVFAKSKAQTIDKTLFKHLSWFPQTTNIFVENQNFVCDINNYANSSCEIRSFTAADEEKYLTWAGSLELIGIPQVAVATNDQIYKLVDDNQGAIAAGAPLDSSIKDVNVVGADMSDGTNKYYSAASYQKFNMGSLKKVFSESEFNCCLPTNQEVPSTTTPGQCCTGNLANVNGPLRCCLPDFTDVTVYLNRYVSSEGRGLTDSAYDPKTGYIKDPGQVKLMVTQKNLCCSGTAMTGVAISKLSIPMSNGGYLPADQLTTSRRFNYLNSSVDNNAETGSIGSIFDAGLRWNNHVYCVPTGFGQ